MLKSIEKELKYVTIDGMRKKVEPILLTSLYENISL